MSRGCPIIQSSNKSRQIPVKDAVVIVVVKRVVVADVVVAVAEALVDVVAYFDAERRIASILT